MASIFPTRPGGGTNSDNEALERLRRLFAGEFEEAFAPPPPPKPKAKPTPKPSAPRDLKAEIKKQAEARKKAEAIAAKIESTSFDAIDDEDADEFVFDIDEARRAVIYGAILERKFGGRP